MQLRWAPQSFEERTLWSVEVIKNRCDLPPPTASVSRLRWRWNCFLPWHKLIGLTSEFPLSVSPKPYPVKSDECSATTHSRKRLLLTLGVCVLKTGPRLGLISFFCLWKSSPFLPRPVNNELCLENATLFVVYSVSLWRTQSKTDHVFSVKNLTAVKSNFLDSRIFANADSFLKQADLKWKQKWSLRTVDLISLKKIRLSELFWRYYNKQK